MPLYIQQAPPVDLPKTMVETKYQEEQLDSLNSNFKIDEEYIQHAHFKNKFISLKSAWINETLFSSSVIEIIENNNFKRIVDMGKNAIPFIIDEIEKSPSSLVWALNIITGATLKSDQRLTISQACRIWVKLFRNGKVQY